ncbi:MAG: hypothetical protein ABW069_20405 [Duganella sp.]
MSTLIELLQGLSLFAALQLAVALMVFAGLLVLFQPLLRGCMRAATLAVTLYFAPKSASFKA